MNRALVHTRPRDWADMQTYPLHPRGRWMVRVDLNTLKWSVGADYKRFGQRGHDDGRWYLFLIRPLPCIEIVLHTPRFLWRGQLAVAFACADCGIMCERPPLRTYVTQCGDCSAREDSVA